MAKRAIRRSAAERDYDLTRLFVDEVSWFMSEHKITRADLAQEMGVSPGRVSQILSGDENLTLRTLSGVLTAVGARPELVLHSVDGPAELSKGPSYRPGGWNGSSWYRPLP